VVGLHPSLKIRTHVQRSDVPTTGISGPSLSDEDYGSFPLLRRLQNSPPPQPMVHSPQREHLLQDVARTTRHAHGMASIDAVPHFDIRDRGTLSTSKGAAMACVLKSETSTFQGTRSCAWLVLAAGLSVGTVFPALGARQTPPEWTQAHVQISRERWTNPTPNLTASACPAFSTHRAATNSVGSWACREGA